MYTLIQSSVFAAWLSALDNPAAKARVLARLKSAMFGNWGDCKPVGDGIFEMRVHVGAGYRVYYIRTDTTVYVLLTGGDKSTQKKDIGRAKIMAKELKEERR